MVRVMSEQRCDLRKTSDVGPVAYPEDPGTKREEACGGARLMIILRPAQGSMEILIGVSMPSPACCNLVSTSGTTS